MPTTTLVAISDMHINSTVGLCPPTVNLDDGGTYRSSKTQRWLWKYWLDFCEEVSRLPGRKVALINGDVGELDTKRRTYQLVTPNKATILDMVIDALEPLLDVVGSIIIVRGTAAHTGKSAWLEEAIANDLDGVIPCGKETASWQHFQGQIAGVRVDAAHHASMGRLPWTEKNAGNKIAAIAEVRYLRMKQKPPHLMIRSHNHRYSDSGGNYEIFAVCTPAWTTPTEYVYRVGGELDGGDVGGMAFVCEDDGTFTTHKYIYERPEMRRVWSLKI